MIKYFNNNPSARYKISFLTDIGRRTGIIKSLRRRVAGYDDPWAHAVSAVAQEYKVDFQVSKPSTRIGMITMNEEQKVVFLSACEKLGVEGFVIDILASDFFERVSALHLDFLMIRPDDKKLIHRIAFDEKCEYVVGLSDCEVYPNALELSFYENKRKLAYFLRTHEVPHPRTAIFYKKEEALEHCGSFGFPVVFKSAVGSCALGVEIARDPQRAKELIDLHFERVYVSKGFPDSRDAEYGYVLMQEFIENVREFRVINIGESWFGHEKAKGKDSDFMSGSGENSWTPPSKELLDFCSGLKRRFGFRAMAYDVFMDTNGQLKVNELQTWFGSYNSSQMYINDIPGRYVLQEDSWVFQPGCFNELGGMLLRLVDLIGGSANSPLTESRRQTVG